MKLRPGIINAIAVVIVMLCGIPSNMDAQVLAFPGAEGFGRYATGGRGGAVIEVTNLNDDGPGSLREAIDASGPRTVVFLVSGTIFLESSLRIDNGAITIAGQTAPGHGITLANYNFNVDADNVIVRYIRSRLGDVTGTEDDAFSCRETENVIIDHCSFSWSVDEAASSYLNRNFTMQWCIISESMYNSVHPKGPHGYGGIWGGSRASFHHNLIAHHTSRNPRFNGSRYIGSPWEEIVDYRNNVVYNWGFNSAYGGEPSEVDGTRARINFVNNYYKAGPGTNSGEVSYRLVSPDAYNGTYSYWYISGNKAEANPQVFTDNWTYGVQGVTEGEKEEMRTDTPFEFEITTDHTADEAYSSVLAGAGVTIPMRDTIDRRIIAEVENGTATYGGSSWGENSGIIDSQEDVGGWPALFSDHYPVDADHDGMADEWELYVGLDPGDPADRNGDLDGDEYTNLEEYLNSIAPTTYFIYPPTQLVAELTAPQEIALSWIDNSTDEDGFFLERSVNGGPFFRIDTLDQDQESYIDQTAGYGSECIYRVSSFNEEDSSVFAVSGMVSTLAANDPPHQASMPDPADGAESVPSVYRLAWQAGTGAVSHKVYIGTTASPEFFNETTDTSVEVTGLEPGTKYYWRVDGVNSNGETTGETWEFFTEISLTDQLVGHWQFESISSVYDSSIFANHGFYYNFLPYSISSNGALGKAIKFNGTNQYIRIPHNDVFDFPKNSFTISMWIRQDPGATDDTKEYRYLIKGSHVKNSGTGSSGKHYELYHAPAEGEVRFVVDDHTSRSYVAAGEDLYVNNEWSHIAAVRDTENSEIRIYSNGNLAGSAADETGDISQQEDLYFGYDPDYQSYFKGTMDDVRLFNYRLTDNEILSLARLGPVGIHSIYSGNSTDISFYPNPTRGRVQVDIHSVSGPVDARISIIDTGGSEQYSRTERAGAGRQTFDLDPQLAPGIYILRVTINNDKYNGKLVIL